jgi:hypothetical protein
VRRWEDFEEEPEERYLGMTALQFNLAFFLVAGVIAAAAFLYFGGTGVLDDLIDDGEPVSSAELAASPTPVASSVTRAPVTPGQAAEAALLTIDDMPSGWTVEPDDGSGAGDPADASVGGEYPAECDFDALALPGELASADSAKFEGADGQTISSGSSVFASEAEAATAFETLATTMDGCQDRLLDLLAQSLTAEIQADSIDHSLDARLEAPKLPALGDSLAAYRLVATVNLEDEVGLVEGLGIEVTLDFVFIRSGALVGGMFYFTPADVVPGEVANPAASRAEEEAILRIAAQKLSRANASLGG